MNSFKSKLYIIDSPFSFPTLETFVGFENYLNGTIWKYFMKNQYIKEGLEILGFKSENVKNKIYN